MIIEPLEPVLYGPFSDAKCAHADAMIAQQRDDELFPQPNPEPVEPPTGLMAEVTRLVKAGRANDALALVRSIPQLRKVA